MSRLVIHEKISLAALGLSIISLPYSIKICHAGLIILFINWLAEGNWDKKILRLNENRYWGLWVLFFLIHLISMLYTENTAQGWFSLEKKISLLIIPVLVLSSSIIAEHSKWLTSLFIASCTAGTVLCLAWVIFHFNPSVSSVLQKIGLPTLVFEDSDHTPLIIWLNFSYISLVSAIGIGPTYFGLYLVTCIIILGNTIYSDQKITTINRLLLWFLITYLALFILFLNSRIITLCLIFVLGTIISLVYRRAVTKLIAISTMIFIMVIVLIFSNPVNRFRSVEELRTIPLTIKPHELYSNSISIRASLWWLSEKVIAKINLWFGAGTGDVTDLIAQEGAHFDIKNILETSDPHNQYIYTWIGVGVIGLFFFLGANLSPLIFDKQQPTFLYASFIIVILTTCLTESLFESQKGIVFFSIFQPLLMNKFPRLS